jgi:hypothetical protein
MRQPNCHRYWLPFCPNRTWPPRVNTFLEIHSSKQNLIMIPLNFRVGHKARPVGHDSRSLDYIGRLQALRVFKALLGHFLEHGLQITSVGQIV